MQVKRTPARTMLVFIVPVVLVLMTAVVIFYFFAPAGRSGIAGRIQSAQLENELKVIVYEDHTAPIVTVQVWYRVGSRNEIVGKRGLAHLLEHMMFKGSLHVGPEEHAQKIDQVGGIANAFTREDLTGYWQTLPSEKLEMALELEAERMQWLQITEEKLQSEREVVKEEHRLSLQNQPFGKVLSTFRGIAFKETPYAWTAAGEVSDLDAITARDLQNFYQDYYVPNNAVLIVVGDVVTPQVFELARKHLGKIKASANLPPFSPIKLPDQASIQEEELKMPVQLPMLLGGYRLPAASSPDLPALEVAGMILSQGESSRLRKKLVRETKLAVEAVGIPLSYRDVGVFIAAAFFTTEQDPEKVKETLLAEIERLKTETITDHELQKAKNQLMAQEIFEQDALSGVAQAIGAAEVILGDYREFLKGADRYAKITPEQILDVANRYFRRENLTLVVLKPEQ